MISRSLALGLLAAGCVAAAGGGAFVAVRQNTVEPAPATAVVAQPASAPQPVAETEAVVTPTAPAPAPVERPAPATVRSGRTETTPAERQKTPRNSRTTRRQDRASDQASPVTPPAPAATPQVEHPRVGQESLPAAAAAPVEAAPEPPRDTKPATPSEPQFQEVTVPESAVIGLQVETAVSSERAQVEDRVTARVTRDVMAAGRVAIPAGSRVLGSVTVVERGGKVKERARLGVRFHTLVLGDGRELPLRTEAIFREGESPAGDSSRKIGGAAVGGAIIGAILGGGKGAVTGGAIGAAGGTAVVMAGDRHAATLPSGAIVTVRLSAPVEIEIENR